MLNLYGKISRVTTTRINTEYMYWKPVEEEKRSLRHRKITFKVNPNNS